jgi:hypothetical protein
MLGNRLRRDGKKKREAKAKLSFKVCRWGSVGGGCELFILQRLARKIGLIVAFVTFTNLLVPGRVASAVPQSGLYALDFIKLNQEL